MWIVLWIAVLECTTITIGCVEKACNNGGTCVEDVNSSSAEEMAVSCICPEGFSGRHCELPEPVVCGEKTCRNGAECMQVDVRTDGSNAKKFVCRCRHGWKGVYCEEDVDECKEYENYCGNGGTCVNLNGSATCTCPFGFTGDRCERPFNRSDFRCELRGFCKNGGTCIEQFCICPDGYSGERCERVVPHLEDYVRAQCKEYPEFCAHRFADGKCDEECSEQNCFYDGFDCVRSSIAKCRIPAVCAAKYGDGQCDHFCNNVECGFDGGDCDTVLSTQRQQGSSLALIVNVSAEVLASKLRPLLAALAQVLHTSVRVSRDCNNIPRIFTWSSSEGVGERIDLNASLTNHSDRSDVGGVLLFVDVDILRCVRRRQELSRSQSIPCFTTATSAAVFLLAALSNPANIFVVLSGDKFLSHVFSACGNCMIPAVCAAKYGDGQCDHFCNNVECGFDGGDCDTVLSTQRQQGSSLALIVNVSPEVLASKLRPLLAALAQVLHTSVRVSRDCNNIPRIFTWSSSEGVGERIDLNASLTNHSDRSDVGGVLLFVDVDILRCVRRRQELSRSQSIPCFTTATSAAVFLLAALSNPSDGERKLLGLPINEVFAEGDRVQSSEAPEDIFRVLISVVVLVLIVVIVVALFGFHGVLKRRARQQTLSVCTWKIPSAGRPGKSVRHECNSGQIDSAPRVTDDHTAQPSKHFLCSSTTERTTASVRLSCEDLLERASGNIGNSSSFESSVVFVEDEREKELEPELIKAVRNGRLDEVRRLVASGVDPNCVDGDGNGALHLAILANNIPVLRTLVATHKFNLYAVNALGQMPLTLTVSKPHVSPECASILLDAMNEENAVIQREAETIASYCELPIINASTPPFATARTKKRSPPQRVPSAQIDASSRFVLSENENRALIDLYGRSALHYAALNNRPELIALFYSNGLRLDRLDNMGVSALHLAAREGHCDSVRMLLSLGANSEITDQGVSALHLAAREGHCDSVRMLLSLGANSEITDQLGRTPFHFAAERNRTEVMKLLRREPISAFRGATLPALKRKRRTKLRKPALPDAEPLGQGYLYPSDGVFENPQENRCDRDVQSEHSLSTLTGSGSSTSPHEDERPFTAPATPLAALRVLTPCEEILKTAQFDFDFSSPIGYLYPSDGVFENPQENRCDRDVQSEHSLSTLTGSGSSTSLHEDERPFTAPATPLAALRVLTPCEEILKTAQFDFDFSSPIGSEESSAPFEDEEIDDVPCFMSDSLVSEQLFKNLEDMARDLSVELSDTMLDE
ncbi:Protein lin-12 [Toxocara canis]|uniref:Protein lin-12 n=1 Tax=Toxocara canis TaxID=6265 RepID=A0A0B2V0N5_TOXCA|nr:Protein lin-12 [Toxocara canis]